MHMLDCCLRWSSAWYCAAPAEVLCARCIVQRRFGASSEVLADSARCMRIRRAGSAFYSARRYSAAGYYALSCRCFRPRRSVPQFDAEKKPPGMMAPTGRPYPPLLRRPRCLAFPDRRRCYSFMVSLLLHLALALACPAASVSTSGAPHLLRFLQALRLFFG
jgi:hypothetical protein